MGWSEEIEQWFSLMRERRSEEKAEGNKGRQLDAAAHDERRV
ncbi:MAG: hypothetical protein AB1671_01165 [Thermodesulfobacteriota bacterium]